MVSIDVRRLGPGESDLARALFTLMATVFGEAHRPLSRDYAGRLLADPAFWSVAALVDGAPVGGLTAHTVPMTNREGAELLLYDVAVDPRHQRRGVGRRLLNHLRDVAAAAGIDTVFVPVDVEDTPALDFYRALGGTASATAIVTFAPPVDGTGGA